MNQQIITRYSYDDNSHKGILKFFIILWSQVYNSKIHIFASIKNEFLEKYYNTALGFIWAIIIPIIPMTAYMLLVYIKAFNSSSDMPYIYYISVGITIWMLMSKIMRQSIMAIIYQRNLLSKTNLPIIAATSASLGEVLFDTIIRFIGVVVILLFFNIGIEFSGLILGLIVLIMLIIFSLSLGMILSIINVILPDTIKIFDIVMRYGIFVSSVIFPFPNNGILGVISALNPFNTYINAFRELIYFGYIKDINLFIYTSVVTLVLFWISAKLIVFMNIRIKAYL